MKFYVYVYRDPSRRNEAIYVGKGQAQRAYVHLNRKDKHPFTHRLQLMKRNGIEPIINVVYMLSEELADQCEIDTIARFGRRDLGKGPLLNLTDGGEGKSGWVPDDKTRLKISIAASNPSAETRLKMSNAKLGKAPHNKGLKMPALSDEHRMKVSQANKGVPKTLDHIQKVSQALKGKTQQNTICPHCGKEGGVSLMRRYHFDNCKYRK